MNTKHNSLATDAPRIVYVREVAVADLPQDLQDEAEGLVTLFAVHSPDGARLALVRDKAVAFALARQNDMAPMSVH